MVRVRVRRVPAAVALVDGVGGARPHVEHDDEDEHHDAEGRHDDADHLCGAASKDGGQCSQSIGCLAQCVSFYSLYRAPGKNLYFLLSRTQAE